MLYEIKTYGDEILREKAKSVEKVDAEIRKLAKDMLETMKVENGVGLAAEQIGKPLSMCVISVPLEYDQDDDKVRQNPDIVMPLVLINPEITWFSKETEVGEEGCLSFPGISVPVERSVEIKIKYLDLDGKPREIHPKKFVARVIQHEYDHLCGILLVDRMSAIKKISLSGQLKRLKKETREKLAMA